MEGVEANESMRSSWEDVHKMPDQADAAQEKPEEEREASEARSPMDIDAGLYGHHSLSAPLSTANALS